MEHRIIKNKTGYYFMSFRDPDRNLNLGVCIVRANSMPEAMERINIIKKNPGGEIAAFALNTQEFNAQELDLDRLYTRQEMKELKFQKMKRQP